MVPPSPKPDNPIAGRRGRGSHTGADMADRLTKLDSKILDTVMDMVENPKGIKTREALQLTLQMMVGVYMSQNEVIDKVETQNGRVGKLEGENIVRWVKSNKKAALIISIIFSAIYISDFRHAIMQAWSEGWQSVIFWLIQ